MVVTLDFPDSKIDKDVRELTGEKGKIVLLSIDGRAGEAVEIKHRYDLAKGQAALTDEFGNLLKGGLKTSEQIADAFYEMDELLAGMIRSWNNAIEKGEALIKDEKYPEAARTLSLFAFASGTEEARKGRKLFDKVSRFASREYESLAAESGDLDEAARKALIGKLSMFIEKWPKTPAAFAAEARMFELMPDRES